ncbi:MAG: Unknown protein [uncultured Thiotrichaceae bacterium]|uniref:Uncharacterized protein n=1 Tax=uncultured Thiotrichaceae bacterium TaxID=298394 RepID=A0A6S6TND3_9GAMM|nr:MAG: Unknown protein [uncultured Thiotrichaceae bacterium]
MKTEEEYLAQINALRNVTVEEYESEIDPLIKELEGNGLLDTFEKVLLELDDSFDDEFYKMVNETMEVLVEHTDGQGRIIEHDSKD